MQRLAWKQLLSPIVVAPKEPISVADIIRYDPDNHQRLYEMGYEDARDAWARGGRQVEGGTS